MKLKFRKFLLFPALLSFVSLMAQAESKGDPVNEEMLRRVSDRLNQQLPAENFPGFRSEKTTAGPGLRWNFFYTLLQHDNSIKADQLVESDLFNPIASQFCATPYAVELLNEGVVFSLTALDRAGKNIKTKDLDYKSCNDAN